ncbi:glycoside hydrolase family 19 protein [Pseudomonas wadenswilerensis]|uniref:glycoside hydrolase family 19 protein n=1 Tax=Pseudomonas wadenswilerensis TaxID=1785161 RepID=UPI00215E0617|nr:glycoside hydrolase family 19 protein [Pseudomonas wadenswilerensis]UVM23815.1 glycoside hydrolase family 19 protein [Pseudomonas wadenswilerensis]
MPPLTEQQLLQILPNARPVAGIFLPALNRAMARHKIDSPVRVAAFLAQIGHESGQLRNLVENLNYSAEALVRTWPSRFTATSAAVCARQPEKIANIVYSGRMGNTRPGDGWRYRGRGLIQLTGRSNYVAAGAGLALPLADNPELLEQPEHAAMSAAWWWSTNGLNELADAGRFQDIGSVINTGKPGRVPHGAAERRALYDLALKVLA